MRLPLITDEEKTGVKILTSALEQLKFHKHAVVIVGN